MSKAVRLSGLVELGDECRVYEDPPEGAVQVGGVDVVTAVAEADFGAGRYVTASIQDERYAGGLLYDFGWGYSEYTPMDPDSLKVGDHDLLEILERYSGQHITLTISDGVVDLSAPLPERRR